MGRAIVPIETETDRKDLYRLIPTSITVRRIVDDPLRGKMAILEGGPLPDWRPGKPPWLFYSVKDLVSFVTTPSAGLRTEK